MTMSVEEYVRAVERSRILMRVLEDDPSDLDARLALANLRRLGLDVPDYEWLLGFDPKVLSEPPPPLPPVPEPEPAHDTLPGVDEWAEPILEEAMGFISVGLKERALPLLEIVLHMQPDNDVARSWLFALKAESERDGPSPSPDETLRIQLPR
jgi:hypothetical protein